VLGGFVVLLWVGFAAAARERVVRSLQTIANLLSALREGDYSIRGRAAGGGALGEAMRELNALAAIFRDQRLGAIEAAALLRTVMTQIDVAVFAFDGSERLKLVNRAGERLLAQPSERLLGRSAEELRLKPSLSGKEAVIETAFPGGAGRWGVKRKAFRQEGERHQLLVLTDLSKALREEERQAFQRLIRVMGHELNNSLAPISSIAGSLERLVGQEPRGADWEDDMRRGLYVIGSRAGALRRFLEGYALLTRLPPPRLSSLSASGTVRRAAALETRLGVRIVEGRDATLRADPDQLEQLLINLIRNAVDASLATGGAVSIGWSVGKSEVEIWVEDEGEGLSETANLFVPFFTTKPQGSGIGLVLSRQIAEAHGGKLRLESRAGAAGCRASVVLPLPAADRSSAGVDDR
jgi:PAS domain S-box-containing protein